jgi:multiple sugar transport system permease protein
MLLLSLLPVLNLVAMSVHSITWKDATASWRFVAAQNFAALPTDTLVMAGLRNTFVFSLCSVCIQLFVAFFLALWCSQVKRGQTFYRMVFILPLLIPGIVVGAIWKLLLNPDFGFMNQILDFIGLDPLDWLGDSRTALLSVIIVDVWHWTPFCFLLLLAGIEGLPQDIYESAKVDGARPMQLLAWITLPLMMPTILVTAVFRFIVAFKVFDEVYLLTGGGPGTSTEVISFTIYQRFFSEDRAGYGSAISVAVIFLVCLMLVVALGARRRFGSGGA